MPQTRRTAPPGDDSRIVGRAAKGDGSAWAELVDRYSAYVYTLLRAARVPDSDQADAFQYVFIELHKGLADLRSTDNLAPWIRQTTLRHAVRLREKLAKGPESLTGWEELATSESFEDAVLAADQGQEIRALVDGQSEKCRQLIEGLFYTDPPKPYAEVAEELGIKPSSMAMTRQRCLDALAKAMRSRGWG